MAGHVYTFSNTKTITRPHAYICARCMRQKWMDGSFQRAYHRISPSKREHDDLLTLLEERGYINQIAGDRNVLKDLLRDKKVGIYAGVDPTAPSLHLGHLLPIMVLFWASLYGHSAVSLVGAATARVGDPSGRLTSRAKTAEMTQMTNAIEMFNQMFALWKTAVRYAERHGYRETGIEKFRLQDNATWLDQLNILDFLKVLGNGMRLGTMLGRDTVRNKMEKGDGMSFSEFTYPLLQAWDWWHMYHTKNVQIQVGGSDQYGNIIAGMDAVKYIAQTHQVAGDQGGWFDSEGKLKSDMAPMGLTVPLLTTASGEKFGKSAGNAIWLDRRLTSSFDLYGFLLRTSDADVERYLKLFTFVPTSDITSTMAQHNFEPGKRTAQQLLASEDLELVHGREEAIKTRSEHEALRNPAQAFLSFSEAASSNPDEPASPSKPDDRIYLPRSLVLHTPFARILYHAGLVPTKSEGARLIAKGGAYIASRTSSDSSGEDTETTWTQVHGQAVDTVQSSVVDGLLVVRVGKWKVRIIEVLEDDVFNSKGIHVPGWEDKNLGRETKSSK